MFNATFIVSLISFILFVFIMNKILYEPIYEIIEKRKKFIDENYNNANINSQKSLAILKDKEDKINKTRLEVKDKFNKVSQIVKSNKNKAIQETKNKAKIKTDKILNEFLKESSKASEVLENDVFELAQIISDKFINSEEKIDKSDNELVKKLMNN